MKVYDYRSAVCEDIRNYINDEGIKVTPENREEIEERLNEELWTNDSVTGNASGSYTFNTWKAEECLCHNLDLLAEACDEFGCNMDVLKDGAEMCDVTIRCYLLSECISSVLDELEESDVE